MAAHRLPSSRVRTDENGYDRHLRHDYVGRVCLDRSLVPTFRECCKKLIQLRADLSAACICPTMIMRTSAMISSLT